MITFETALGLKIRVSGRSVTDAHTRLIQFLKELKKIVNQRHYAHYEYMREDILKALDKYEIDLDVI